MADNYDSFVEFIEKFVLPLRKVNPDWKRLNGDQHSDRTPAAYLMFERRTFCVHADSIIESLLAPYYYEKQGKPEPALVVGKTLQGKREKLKPMPSAGSEKGFFIYQNW